MRALVLTNGDYGQYGFCSNLDAYDFVVCADNGMRHARKLRIIPHIIVGDFDSSNLEDRSFFENAGVEFIEMPSEKDETDTEIAVMVAIEKGCKVIDIYGGAGYRMDHTLANIQLIARCLEQGVCARLLNDHNVIRVIDHSVVLEGNVGQLVSLMPLTERVRGITTEGLAYALHNASLKIGDTVGVSNVMTDSKAKISITEGRLVVLETCD